MLYDTDLSQKIAKLNFFYFGVFHFHAQFMEERYGTINGVDTYQRAEQRIKNYNEKHGLELAKIAQTQQGETIVAVCDLFSRQVILF